MKRQLKMWRKHELHLSLRDFSVVTEFDFSKWNENENGSDFIKIKGRR